MNVGPRDPLAAATKWSLVSPERAHAAAARRRRASISRGHVLRAQSPLVADAKGIADSALISQVDRQVLVCIADWLTHCDRVASGDRGGTGTPAQAFFQPGYLIEHENEGETKSYAEL